MTEARNSIDEKAVGSLFDVFGGLKESDEASASGVEASDSTNDALREREPEESSDDILLSMVDGVGPLTAERLVDYFGSSTAALDASLSELSCVEKVGPTLARKIVRARETFDVVSLIRFCRENDIQILSLNDSRYPTLLRRIANPPRILYVRGRMISEDRFSIAMVGTRRASSYGRAQATRLAREIVDAGFTVTSGLALGIDGCAHRGALDAGGRTIAVLGGGVANIFPPEHEDLAGRIVSGRGAVVSEYHPLTSPLRGNFPARNRVISGLSLGVLVVESATRGGSLITARFAAEHNRELFAIPGPVDSESSRGCNQLLREGALLVESVEDILNALPSCDKPKPRDSRSFSRDRDYSPAPRSLGISVASIASIDTRRKRESERSKIVERDETLENSKKNARSKSDKSETVASSSKQSNEFVPLPDGLNENELKFIEAVGDKTRTIDELIERTGFPVARVLGLLAVLEFKRVVTRLEGNAVARRKQ